jgi:hypothetical protein
MDSDDSNISDHVGDLDIQPYQFEPTGEVLFTCWKYTEKKHAIKRKTVLI